MNTDDLLGCYRRQIERLEALLEIRERRIAELEASINKAKQHLESVDNVECPSCGCDNACRCALIALAGREEG